MDFVNLDEINASYDDLDAVPTDSDTVLNEDDSNTILYNVEVVQCSFDDIINEISLDSNTNNR